MVLRSTLGLHEKSIVKISFKQKPQSLETRGISARKAQRTRIHQPVQILGASLDPICQSKSKEIPKKGQPNLSVRKARNDHESGNVIITTEQTEKMFDCSESLNETVVNEQTGILQQYFSYQEQMNNKHPQRRKKVVGTHAIVSPQSFNHPTFQCAPSNFGGNSYQSDLKSITPQAAQMPYPSGLFYKTGNPSQRKASISNSKNEIWKQALQRLNDPTNKVAMISQVESDNCRYAQSALDVRRNSRYLQNQQQPTKQPELLNTNFKPTPTNNGGASQGRLDTSSFLNRLSLDNGSNNAQYQSQFQDPKTLLTTTVLLLTNNQNTNKTFEKTQGTTTAGTQVQQQRHSNNRDGSKSPVTIEVKQIGNPSLGIGGGTNQGSLGGQNNQSFTKKSFADKIANPPVIDQVDPVIFDINPKPSPIIVNKNQHFKYKMRRKEDQQALASNIEALSQPQFIHKKNPKSIHGTSNGVVARLLSPTLAISDDQHQNFIQHHHHNKSKSTINQERASGVKVDQQFHLLPLMTPVISGQQAFSGGHLVKGENRHARVMAQQYGTIQSRMNQFVPNQ
ncbi:hypothetical protein FGO68_gene15344 [Halteria grandinella]|uniref:Uncharacterized protein n=1 Tax=Halteria grandinella TaxID=5974 RepID=A0A8J8P5J1_HALGN|nr:hypothetical protein FGO68_gene15344 [Halteria grandinella]